MPSSLRSLVALTALLVAAPRARAQPRAPEPPPQAEQARPEPGLAAAPPDEWERVPAPQAAAAEGPPAGFAAAGAPEGGPAPAPHAPVVRLVVQVGFDYGFEELLEVEYTNRRDDAIRANGGVVYALGATFLPLSGGRLYTQATLGFKYDSIDADNGSASFWVFPLEVIEFFQPGAFRVGAGLSLALGARTRGDGVLEGFDADYDAAVGLVAAADYVWRFRGAARGQLTVGPRLLLQELETRGGSTSASAAGVMLGFTF